MLNGASESFTTGDLDEKGKLRPKAVAVAETPEPKKAEGKKKG